MVSQRGGSMYQHTQQHASVDSGNMCLGLRGLNGESAGGVLCTNTHNNMLVLILEYVIRPQMPE